MRAAISFLLVALHSLSATAQLHHIDSLKLIGIKTFPTDYKFQNTVLGGISGIDRAPDDTYYLISDDKAEASPVRFYTAHMYYTASSFDSLVLSKVVFIKNEQHKEYAKNTCDPESIRFDRSNHTLLWSSEGIYNKIQPAVNRIDKRGNYISTLPLPKQFIYSNDTNNGLHSNEAIEGISLANHNKDLWIVNESPAYQDGPQAKPYHTRSPLRLSLIDTKTGKVKKQFAYMLEPVADAPEKPTDFYINGVSELLSINDSTLLIIERSYTKGMHNTIRIYEASINGATDVKSMSGLKEATYTPVRKKLITNLKQTGLNYIDNIEGVTFGKPLPNGHQTLIFVSDNNFSSQQQTQIIICEVYGQ